MAWSPFVPPETVRIALPGLPGQQWIDVKKRLTIKERREAQAQVYGVVHIDGSRRMDFKLFGIAEMAAYVTAWSFGPSVTVDSIGNLDESVFDALDSALDQHKLAMERARDEEKNGQGTSTESAAI